MKICCKCKEEKSENDFALRKKGKDARQSMCRACNALVWKKYYSENREYRIKYSSEFIKLARIKLREWFHSLKNKPCVDCNIIYGPWVMEFDHVSGKTKNVSEMVKRNCSKETILKEMEKCELVCANCHRERTWKRFHKITTSDAAKVGIVVATATVGHHRG